MTQQTENPFNESRLCCKRWSCFSMVDKNYAFAQYRRFLSMDREQRKRALTGMLDREDNCFYFNGRKVCTRFLSIGMKFSKVLQACVKGTDCARASSSIKAVPRESMRIAGRDVIILFINSLADNIGDYMPHISEVHLPHLQKTVVWELFKEDFEKVQSGPNAPPEYTYLPSQAYFYRVWKEHCTMVKIRKHHMFAKCADCEFFRIELHKCGTDDTRAASLRAGKKSHLAKIREERKGYYDRRSKAVRNPARYSSIIVDGADHTGTGLPHFVFKTKAEKGHKFGVKVVGVLEHGPSNSLTLYTMTEEWPTGANHVIEALHRTLQANAQSRSSVPPILFVQFDNCTRENKNRYTLSYLEMLVANGVYQELYASFLPIGHTHEDVDQAFSRISQRLKSHEL